MADLIRLILFTKKLFISDAIRAALVSNFPLTVSWLGGPESLSQFMKFFAVFQVVDGQSKVALSFSALNLLSSNFLLLLTLFLTFINSAQASVASFPSLARLTATDFRLPFQDFFQYNYKHYHITSKVLVITHADKLNDGDKTKGSRYNVRL